MSVAPSEEAGGKAGKQGSALGERCSTKDSSVVFMRSTHVGDLGLAV